MDMLKMAITLAAIAFVGCGEGGTESVVENVAEEVPSPIVEESDRLIDWVGADDGILVQDLNGDGQIQQNEFFGNPTMTGRPVDNGFEDMALLDYNDDGIVDSLPFLRVWKDSNGNAVVDPGELLTFDDAGVAEVRLAYRDTGDVIVKQLGSFKSPRTIELESQLATGNLTDLGLLQAQPELEVENNRLVGCAWFHSQQSGEANPWAIMIVDLDGGGVGTRDNVEVGQGYPVKDMTK